jgi:2-amino-4-hydroxy-6-hydroxymethyldihydropteridine diphosphokinase
MTIAALGLGSNIGDRAAFIARALDMLEGDGCRVVSRSPLYQTTPWGDTDQDDFLNGCALVETSLPPHGLLDRCLQVEAALGRSRTRRWGPRIIDIDMLFYGEETIASERLTLPHPFMLERAFVLRPLMDIAPDKIIAGVAVRDAFGKIASEPMALWN